MCSSDLSHGPYLSLRDFIERTCGRDMNKRAIENLIKAGALDGLGGTRKQLMVVYPQVLDSALADSKEKMDGQISIFDLMSPEVKKEYEIQLPPIGEFSKEESLGYEKEVLGVYLSGHPLEEWEDLLMNHVSAVSSDFMLDEETNEPKVQNGAKEIIGGMITNKTIKYTKTNKTMAFITVEDLVGSVEVLIFPKIYERCKDKLVEDSKIFVEGRVSSEDEKPSKLICDTITEFSEIPRELWVAFPGKEEWLSTREEFLDLIAESDGIDPVFIYLRNTKSYQRLPGGRRVKISGELLSLLSKMYGNDSVTVRVARKSVEK